MTPDLEAHRALLHDVAYRITGAAQDADDLVQEAFVRALARPPADRDRPWRPWLVRVVANLAKDQLRARRRRYRGHWLPGPLAVDALADPGADPAEAALRRERVGWATLVALEALTPQQRAVLVLRDVAELGADEVADALGTTAEAVRAAHARARRALAAAGHAEPADLDAATLAALQRLVAAVVAGDLDGLRAVLVEDATLVSDTEGRYRSAVNVLRGWRNVARFLVAVARKNGPLESALVRVNDRPALFTRLLAPPRRVAPETLLVLVLAPDGRIASVHTQGGPGKLARLGRPVDAAGPPAGG